MSVEPLDAEQALLRFAVKYAFDEPHARQVARLAGQLAERLAPMHDLDEGDLLLLRHAALVHDVGYFVAGRRHQRHSAYLIAADDALQDYPAALRERLALLARSHRKRLPDLPKRWGRQACDRFRQAAALLRLADGLDYAHDAAAAITACHIGPHAVVVEVEGVELAEVDRVLRRKSALFAATFDRDVSFVPSGATAQRPSR